MSLPANVVIKDACIFFDLIDMELLGCFYKLNITVITRPEVIAEIRDENQLRQILPFINCGSLQIDMEEILEIVMPFAIENPGLSITDVAVLETASRRHASILSSDKSLRNESVRRGIKVKGLLWILEELYLSKIITRATFVAKLEMYPTINRRAPIQEIKHLKNKYY